ncbi:Glu/Leu/Phe/Val family dehydrogenase [Metabacillus sediminilitoris]|uniref:Glutamate dehydrogenase n=1 Tax=Metabacillus sediminilitoris TaxID=2567941 RepID=A0A4S4C451_9BACI|nr:Glu/Leu/Phe/Val dehydrogenase [Metabacillus sediminilitoris]QGQ45159.1 glutamate dehydrogenase [Metabacillus sediminilitoris]THF82542.1 Glu/Leu/Phe/Val dehydrogenase [Metabacillus sediminilitoris]
MTVSTAETKQNHSVKEQLSNTNPLIEFQAVLKEAIEVLRYPNDVFEFLKEPMRFLEVSIPVRMDNNTTKVFRGYRAQHNDANGPTKGGIRFHPDVTPEEVKALSGWMSMKCGITGLPYGGAKGGIVCDPRNMSLRELELLSRGYVRAVSQIVGPTKDIPAPDMYTNSQIMAWMLDEYDHIREFDSPGFITGKPLALGGSEGRETATSKGVLYTLERICELKKIPIKEMTVIIQGFGNVGSFLAKYLYELGAKVVGISDVLGGIYDPNGLDIPLLLNSRDSFGIVSNDIERSLSNQDLLEKECDILIPAAIGGQITKNNANNIKCQIVIEAANGPTTKEAAKILQERDILVVPDILANSGGVIVSYFEWCQNNQGYYWTEEKVDQHLKEKISSSFEKVFQTSQCFEVDMRIAAYIEGIRRVTEASRLRGWITW